MAGANLCIRLGLVLACAAVEASCRDEGPKHNPYALVDLDGADDFAVTTDGRFVATSRGQVFGTVPGVVVFDEATLAVDRISTYGGFRVSVGGDTAYVVGASVYAAPLGGGDATYLSGPWGSVLEGVLSDGVYLFVASEGAIFQRELSTGTDATLVAPSGVWGALVGDSTHLYWINDDQTIARIPKSGGTPETVFNLADHPSAGTGQLFSLALDDGFVYVGSNATVLRFSKTSMSVEVLATGQQSVHAVAVDATHVYWARGFMNHYVDYPGEVDVVRRPLAGGEEQVIASGQNGVSRIVLLPDRIVWNEIIPGDLASAPLPPP